jgi:hypothetical protein
VKPGINLLIGIPNYGYRPHVGCCLALLRTQELLLRRGLRHAIVPASGFSMVTVARNILANGAAARRS